MPTLRPPPLLCPSCSQPFAPSTRGLRTRSACPHCGHTIPVLVPAPADRRQRRLVLVGLALAILVLIGAVSWLAGWMLGGRIGSPFPPELTPFAPQSGMRLGPFPEGAHEGEPRTPEEKEVAARLTRDMKPGDRVEWIRWGPHDLTGLTHDDDPQFVKIVRVRFRIIRARGSHGFADLLVTIDHTPPRVEGTQMIRRNDTVPAFNLSGSDWLAERVAAREKAREESLRGYGRP